jgi:nucleotide-binding universal stress UspA family protein
MVSETDLQRAAEQALEDWARRFPMPGELKSIVRGGDTAHVILEEAKTHEADLLVVGTRGRRGLSHAVLGSTAEKLVRLSPIPVLVVHAQSVP